MKALSFDDITLIPRYNNIASRKDVDTSVQFGQLKLNIPVASANMDTITGCKMAREMRRLGGIGFLHRFCSIEENVTTYVNTTKREPLYPNERPMAYDAVVSLGVNEELERAESLYEVGARMFCIDMAHGHSEAMGDMIRRMRDTYDDVFLIAGNVCTAEGAEWLVANGADAVKVGIGPGSACQTRVKTGFGIPQFTAIQECRHVNCFLIADGGIRTPGDAVKAFAAGADMIMLGGMLAGTDETPGDYWTNCTTHGPDKVVLSESYKIFRGMASREAQEDFMGSMADWKTAEGVEIKVKPKGPVAGVMSDLMGGIRSGMCYCGANTISEIRQRARWIEISAAGAAEGKPHGEGRL